MKKSQLITSCAVLAGLSFSQSQVALAGWFGQMNGVGVGVTSANVTGATTGLNNAATSTTSAPGQNLSAAVKQIQPAGYAAFKSLPTGASGGTTALIQGLPGYVWKATTLAVGGDRTDNETIEAMTDVTPSSFALLSLETKITVDDNGRTLTVDGISTAGTAILIQAFQSSQTTFGTDGEFNGFHPLNVLFSDLHVGEGQPLAGGPIDSASIFHFTIPLPDPKSVPDTDLILQIDGFAASTVPDSGWLGLSFTLAVAGIVVARRFVAQPTASA